MFRTPGLTHDLIGLVEGAYEGEYVVCTALDSRENLTSVVFIMTIMIKMVDTVSSFGGGIKWC